MPMQPSPIAETSRPLFPSLRFSIALPFLVPGGQELAHLAPVGHGADVTTPPGSRVMPGAGRVSLSRLDPYPRGPGWRRAAVPGQEVRVVDGRGVAFSVGEYDMDFGMQRAMRPGGLCVSVAGEVDAYTAPGMQAELIDALRSHPVVIVDLSAVTFMDSQGLAAFIRAHQEAESSGGTLRLAGVPARVRQLLTITGLDSMLAIDPDPPGR